MASERSVEDILNEIKSILSNINKRLAATSVEKVAAEIDKAVAEAQKKKYDFKVADVSSNLSSSMKKYYKEAKKFAQQTSEKKATGTPTGHATRVVVAKTHKEPEVIRIPEEHYELVYDLSLYLLNLIGNLGQAMYAAETALDVYRYALAMRYVNYVVRDLLGILTYGHLVVVPSPEEEAGGGGGE